MVRRFRKRPVEIDALHYNEDTDAQFEELKAFVGEALFVDGKTSSTLDTGIKIHTLEGDYAICKGDFIIKGVKGEFYPCKPDIFAQTYEPIF